MNTNTNLNSENAELIKSIINIMINIQLTAPMARVRLMNLKIRDLIYENTFMLNQYKNELEEQERKLNNLGINNAIVY